MSREVSGAKEIETHFARVLRVLDIELICAHSPQARGRVERANEVIQDRLIKEMRLRKISTIEDANKFLPEFIEEYNWKFGIEPRDEEDAHRSVRKEDDLERIFARRTVRKLSKSLSFQYEGKCYQLHPANPNRFRSSYVNILERTGKPLLVESGSQELPYTIRAEIPNENPIVLDSKQLEAHWPKKKIKKPIKYHPWR